MDVLEAINKRRSVRVYSSEAIPADVTERMRQALRSAPSAGNHQPWHFVFVMEKALRRKVARVSGKQLWIADAPVTVVACGFPEQAYKEMGGYGNSADVDVAIALDHLTLAAAAEGLGTCWIGSFEEEQVKRLLDIPSQAKVIALTPLGYPSSPSAIRSLDDNRRKPAPEIFSIDRYGGS